MKKLLLVFLATGLISCGDSHQNSSHDEGLLYVQNARSLTLTSSSMTLEGLYKHTTWFTDRPERKAGKIANQIFFDVWNSGDDSFGEINPNAALVCMTDSEVIEHVVTLSRPDYSAENDDVTYDIQYIDSTGPADTETCTSEVSLFIDETALCKTACEELTACDASDPGGTGCTGVAIICAVCLGTGN